MFRSSQTTYSDPPLDASHSSATLSAAGSLMSSIRQIAANRLNSQKSTGPRTADGKAASSRNSLKSGIYAKSLLIRGEKLADLESLVDGFYDIQQPVGADQRPLVHPLTVHGWL